MAEQPVDGFSIESIFTPELIADPYPTYHALRASSPVLELSGLAST